MYRRSVISCLGAGALGAVAGCAGGDCGGQGKSVEFEPVDGSAIASEMATADLDPLPGMTADLVTKAIDGEAPEIEIVGLETPGVPRYVERNGRFYEIDTETVATGTVSGPEYELSRDFEVDGDVPDDAVSFAELPRRDRWRVAEAAGFRIERLESLSFTGTFDAGYLEPGDGDESILAAGVDASALEVDGSFATLERLDEREANARLMAYTGDVVAEDVAGFAGHVLDGRGAVSDDPSDDVELLLDEARENDGRVSVCTVPVEDGDEDEGAAARRRNAVAELERRRDAMESRAERDDEASPEPVEYVRYEDEWYRIDVTKWAI